MCLFVRLVGLFLVDRFQIFQNLKTMRVINTILAAVMVWLGRTVISWSSLTTQPWIFVVLGIVCFILALYLVCLAIASHAGE